MMKICEAKYYTYYNLTEYHSTLFYMLHNEIRLQTFQEQSKVCRKSILKQAKKIHLILIFKDDTLPKEYVIQNDQEEHFTSIIKKNSSKAPKVTSQKYFVLCLMLQKASRCSYQLINR